MSMKGKGGKGGKGGSGGKSRAGGGSVIITKSKARETNALEGSILTLRRALFEEDGRNKDVTAGIAPAFLRYDRKGLDVAIRWSAKLSKEEVRWAFSTIKEARFLVVRECQTEEEEEEEEENGGGAVDGGDDSQQQQQAPAKKKMGGGSRKKKAAGALVAIVHFRFTVNGEFMDEMAGEPCLIVWDMSVDSASQRKGLGRHLLTLLELIARRESMSSVSLPVMLGDDVTTTWITTKARGYQPDQALGQLVGFDAEVEGFQVYTKDLAPPPPPLQQEKQPE